ncbi:MAG: protein kinase [Vicinamibacteria bacterium]
MSLTSGSRLGPYEIIAAIGAGGMGEVFRACDTKLNRDVAIKVLPAAFAQDHERVARFKREAQVLASLNHPNIAAIYGLEESVAGAGAATVIGLVLELVEGEDIAQRLERGPLPVDEVIAMARQIAEGLEAAHEKGIIHRDLKPANIKVTPDGTVKLLDFGLAKALDVEAGTNSGSSQLSHSPTMSRHATEEGMIMGTAAYMSPEQARGKTVDRRSDIWSFGVVLFEMLTGTRLFAGETVSDVLAAVLTREPDWKALPASTPMRLRRLIERCLERDPKQRLRDIGEARVALSSTSTGVEPASTETMARAPSSSRRLPLVIAALLIIAAGITGFMVRGPRDSAAAPRGLTVFGVPIPPEHALTASQSPLVDISADGHTILFAAEGEKGTSIFRRSLDSLAVTRIDGTVGAENPVISPDGRTVAFFADKMVRRVPIEGGVSVAIAPAQAPRGLAWARDGSLVFSPVYNSGLFRVSGTGGAPVELTKLDITKGERTHRWPQILPDGRTVIFTVGLINSPGDYDDGNIDAQRLDTGERRTILKGARMARYTSLGYLVYQRKQTLLAVRFDPERLEAKGEPFTLQEGLGGDVSSGSGYFAVSDNGVVASAPETATPKDRFLALLDRAGHETLLNAPPAAFNHPRFSPDGTRLAFAIGGGSGGDDDIYTLDLRSQHVQRLTFGQGYAFPLWSLDGRQIILTVGRAGEPGIQMRAANGSGKPVMIVSNTEQRIPDAWLPDGKRLAVTTTEKSIDIQLMDTGAQGALTPLIASPTAGESAASFSPDGRYIAYTTTETGTEEVMVESFPLGQGRWQVSTAGGSAPVWSHDGRKLYFVIGQSLMEAELNAGGVFSASVPRALITGPYDFYRASARNYDVGRDGRFALVKRPLGSKDSSEIVVIDGALGLDPSKKTIK